MRLLFVCTGNTCRSPLAEAAWRAFGAPILLQQGERSVAMSAGLAAVPGQGAAKNSKQVAQGWGQDLSDHRSRRLTAELANATDYIFTMTKSQLDSVQSLYPNVRSFHLGAFAAAKILPPHQQRLTELLNSVCAPASTPDEHEHDIPDPIGCSLEAYQACGEIIHRAVISIAISAQPRQKQS
jgi:protein-tyrosine-phosphatase